MAGEDGSDTYFGGGADSLSEFAGDFDDADLGNDVMNGGGGPDRMEGNEGTDELYGGPDNDFIDADNFESVGTPDLVNGGDGFDVCIVNENDAPVVNCERIETESDPTAASAAGAR